MNNVASNSAGGRQMNLYASARPADTGRLEFQDLSNCASRAKARSASDIENVPVRFY
jgi:hypothetical protein